MYDNAYGLGWICFYIVFTEPNEGDPPLHQPFTFAILCRFGSCWENRYGQIKSLQNNEVFRDFSARGRAHEPRYRDEGGLWHRYWNYRKQFALHSHPFNLALYIFRSEFWLLLQRFPNLKFALLSFSPYTVKLTICEAPESVPRRRRCQKQQKGPTSGYNED